MARKRGTPDGGPPNEWQEALRPLMSGLYQCTGLAELWPKLAYQSSAVSEAEAAAWLVEAGCEEVAFVHEAPHEARPDLRAVLGGHRFWVEVKQLDKSPKTVEQEEARAQIREHVHQLRATGGVNVYFPGLLPRGAACPTVAETCCYVTHCWDVLGGASPASEYAQVFVHPDLTPHPLRCGSSVYNNPEIAHRLQVEFQPGWPEGEGRCFVCALDCVDRSAAVNAHIGKAGTQLAAHQPGLLFLRVLDPGVWTQFVWREHKTCSGEFVMWTDPRFFGRSIGGAAAAVGVHPSAERVVLARNPEANTALPDCVVKALERTRVTTIARRQMERR